VTNKVFANDDLTTTIPYSAPVEGTTWAYSTPLPLSTGGTLYFTSVQGVDYSQRPGNSGSQISAISVSPGSSTMAVNTTQTFTAVVSDAAGAGDIAGLDLQFRDNTPSVPTTCWIFFNATNNTMAINYQNNWGAPTPIGSSGSTLTGDDCTVDTTAVTVSASGNNLTLNVPVTVTFADNNTWHIFVDAQNKENLDSGYTHLATVTVQSSSGAQNFMVSLAPRETQYQPAGSSTQYTVTITTTGGFDQPITFQGFSTPSQSGNTTQLSFAFNPATVTGPGTTTMTVTSPASATPDYYSLVVSGVAQSLTQSSQPVQLRIDNAPPAITLSPTSGTGSSANFVLTWSDSTQVSYLNLLIAPSLNGSNACWIFFDTTSRKLYLASDDVSSWTYAYQVQSTPFNGPTTGPGASNSQCTFGSNATWDADSGAVNGFHSGHNMLTIPVTFKPAFAGTKTTYVNGANGAGFVSGYQPMGGWTVQ
jgi:hypothetical protein